jgi:hypothetical protein
MVHLFTLLHADMAMICLTCAMHACTKKKDGTAQAVLCYSSL